MTVAVLGYFDVAMKPFSITQACDLFRVGKRTPVSLFFFCYHVSFISDKPLLRTNMITNIC